MFVNLGYDLLMVLLETGHISWDEYASGVPVKHRPEEYKDLPAFLRNKGKASTRIIKRAQWKRQAERED